MMNLTKAIDILTEHNKWRRGEPPYDGIPSGVDHATPKDIGEAIDFAISRLSQKTKGDEPKNEKPNELIFYDTMGLFLGAEKISDKISIPHGAVTVRIRYDKF